MRYVRLYADPKRRTHFEQVPERFDETDLSPPCAAILRFARLSSPERCNS